MKKRKPFFIVMNVWDERIDQIYLTRSGAVNRWYALGGNSNGWRIFNELGQLLVIPMS